MSTGYSNFKGILSDETITEMEKHYTQLSPRLQKIHLAIQDSLELNDLNISDKCKVAPQIVQGWLSVLYQEERVLKKLNEKRELVKKTWQDTHGVKNEYTFKNNILAENNCPELKKIDLIITEQDEIVRYLREAVKIIKDLHWNLKNLTAIIQLEH